MEKHPNFIKPTISLDEYPKVKGINFDKPLDLSTFLSSYANTGMQATQLGHAINITQKMIDEKASIFLSCTGNAISSGLRDIITWLVKKKKIKGIVTSIAGIEEDIIKSLKPFVIGDFEVSGSKLFDSGVGRIGNIFVPFDRYLYFEKFIDPLLEKIYKKYKGKQLTGVQLVKELGLAIDNKDSFIYQAAKNDIPIFCPALMDGSFGDLCYFFKKNHKDFVIDTIADNKILIDLCLEQKKVGAIILGGGASKHFLLNANILREGLDYAVYLTTAQEFDGSDSGGNQEEAKSWGKIQSNAPSIKVKADFTLTFPILIAASFAASKNLKKS